MTSHPFGATVLEHFRRPRNMRDMEHPAATGEGSNPLCGDRVRIQLAIEDGRVSAAAFTASACALCTASASMLTERVAGVAVAEALSVGERDVLALLDSEIPQARAACATLPLRAMQNALESWSRGAAADSEST